MTQDDFDKIAHRFGVEHPFELAAQYGLTKEELLAHMRVHNDRIFEVWLTDYARRLGRPVNEVRAEVTYQRRIVAEHCNQVH